MDEIKQGTNVETLSDVDHFRVDNSVNSLDDLVKEVDSLMDY